MLLAIQYKQLTPAPVRRGSKVKSAVEYDEVQGEFHRESSEQRDAEEAYEDHDMKINVGVAREGAERQPIKVTVVGDNASEKTSLLVTYATGVFPEEYVPTVYDNSVNEIAVDGQNFNMSLWDTAGQEDFERLRPLSYPNTNCFLLCFSVGDKSSFDSILTKWYPEIHHFCPNVPIILVGTNIDLREEGEKVKTEEFTISTAEGICMKNKIKAWGYIECSAKFGEHVDDVFTEAVRAVMKKQGIQRNNFSQHSLSFFREFILILHRNMKRLQRVNEWDFLHAMSRFINPR